MSLRTRSLHIAVMLALIAGLLTTLIGAGVQATPADRTQGFRAQQQAEFDDYPPSVTLLGEQFILDRLVPLDRADFERIADEANIAFYARTPEPPFDTIYGLISGRSEAGMARYLPTNRDDPETPCQAEAITVGPLTGGDATYAFAGIETDIPTDALEEIAEADGQPVYADPEGDQPSPELFLESDDGLLRFLITEGSGLPAALPDDLPFADQAYSFETDATDTVDPGTLGKIGCVGPFPAFIETAPAVAPFTQIYVLAASRYLSFTATGPAPDDAIGGADGESESTPADDEEQAPDDAETDIEEETPAASETAADDGQDDSGEITEETPAGDDASPAAETPADTDDEATGDGLPIEISADLGNGGQPDDLPRELVVGDARYLFDRNVPLNADDLTQVAQDDTLISYTQGEDGPFNAIFVARADGSNQGLARYLPEQIDAPDTACPAEAVEIGQLDAGGTFYAFAGIETDLTGDLLEQIAESGGEPVYADPNVAAPQPELFVTDANGLLRFLVLGEDGRPTMLAESLAFAGLQFTFSADVTDSVDRGELAKVGCAGPFPVYSDPEQAEGGYTDLYVWVGGLLFQFTGEGEPVEDASPTDVPADTEVPTEAPTETAAPTEAPTETAVPTDTEVPTEEPTTTEEPTEVSTETEVPTEAPTETAVPTDTEAPTEVPTETTAPTEAPTEAVAPPDEPSETAAPDETATETAAPTEAATDVPAAESPTAEAETATTVPAEPEEIAQSVDLPATIEIQNTTYIFNRIEIDIDIETLVQVEVIVVNNVELTVYARQQVQGVAPELYCVNAEGEVVGQYVLAAGAQPSPPAELPDTVSIENTIYIFNEVEIDIDIQILVQVQVVVINNIELMVYEEPSVPGRPERLFVVAPGGDVVGQYVETALVVTFQQTTAASTAVPTNRCTGSTGPTNDVGLPTYLPNRFQWSGIAYTFVRVEAANEASTLTRIGCIGPFEVASTDAEPRSEVLYLRVTSDGQASQQVYRFEVAITFEIEIGVSGNPRTIRIGDEPEGQYRLRQTWLPYIYSGQTVILFVEDPEDPAPDVFLAVNVRSSVVGEVIGEYRLPGETTEPSDAMVEAAEGVGLNPDLTIAGQIYLLVNIYRPTGTTSDGFVTLFAIESEEGTSAFLLGRDKRRTELFIYDRTESE